MEGLKEFFINGEDVLYEDVSGINALREGSPVVMEIIDKVRELYPQAYDALCTCYERSRANIPYFNFLVARRFCKCNFGSLDHTKKDVDGERLNLERVACPLQGECRYEGIICSPKMESKITEAEKRVMRLVCLGKSNSEIAEELYLSPNTVRRHISNAYIKTRTRNRAEFVKYANENLLF